MEKLSKQLPVIIPSWLCSLCKFSSHLSNSSPWRWAPLQYSPSQPWVQQQRLLCLHSKSLLLFHRITGRLKLEGASGGHLARPSCSGRDTLSRLSRTTSRLLLNISKERNSTTSLGSLFWKKKKNASWCSDRTSCVPLCSYCLLSWHWVTIPGGL